MKKSAQPLHLTYSDAPFVEEFINRFGTGFAELMSFASHYYRRRGSASIPNWEDYCYLPVNVAVGYCKELGMDDHTAAFNAKLLATAQAFLASHLMVRMDVRESRAAWRDHPCTGVIPFDDLMNVPTFGYVSNDFRIPAAPINDMADGKRHGVQQDDAGDRHTTQRHHQHQDRVVTSVTGPNRMAPATATPASATVITGIKPGLALQDTTARCRQLPR